MGVYGLWLGIGLIFSTISMPFAETVIVGKMTPCSDEGEKINVEKEGVRCFTCVCKNRYVECLKEYCPSLEGCHMLMEKPKGACCAKCKGCFHDGTMRESGEEWSALGDPCRVMTCKAGVVTETRQECYTPCSNPIPPAPGQCCPTCPGCLLNRENVTEDLEVAWVEDPCVRCRCQKGRLACYKRACPVLNCHSAFIEMKPGHCCPRCKRSSRIFEPPNGSCLLGNKLHQSSEEFHPDLCTKCTCSNRTSHCVRHTCPPLDCPPEHQDTPKNHCCPICMNVIETKPTCTHAGRTYKDGEGWKLDECQSCMCKKGQVRCTVAVCPESNKPCPLNHKLTKLPGHCCPKCVESDGICTVFGDPHYRTFDGKFFSFQGSCKYQLTADCIDHTFSIRVTNDARHTKTSSWTKTVSIKIAGWKVNLGERKRVKLSGVKVKVPFMSRKVNITNTDDSILVETELGIKVVWDGNSFLEVSVPPRYKEKLCGLCGNYNGLSRDDMLSRRGIYMIEGDRLGASWRVGGRKACTRSPRISKKSKQCSPKTMRPGLRKALHRMCAPLSSSVFAACHNKLNYDIYKESCLVDMCECPTMKCYCESFTAYAHECRRLGVPLVNWRAETNCTTLTRHKGQ